MLKQVQRSFITAIFLLSLFTGSSALAAHRVRPAKPRAEHVRRHRAKAPRKTHKKGTSVRGAALALTQTNSEPVLLGDSAVESQHDFLAGGTAEVFRFRRPRPVWRRWPTFTSPSETPLGQCWSVSTPATQGAPERSSAPARLSRDRRARGPRFRSRPSRSFRARATGSRSSAGAALFSIVIAAAAMS